MPGATIDVIIVDDSPAMRQLLELLLKPEADIRVIAMAETAAEGWAAVARQPPDVMILDLELPDRPGMDLLRRVMRERPTPVVIVSANAAEGSAATVAALSAGAVAFIEKPNSIDISVEAFRGHLIQTLRVAARSGQALTRLAPKLEAPGPSQAASLQPQQLKRERVIAIGASTGGVAAIQHLLGGLGGLDLPILITQHMPAGYTRRFAERLQQTTKFRAKEAEDGDRLVPGQVLIAPGDRHLVIENIGGSIGCRLEDGPPVSGHRPSVDVMMQSVARILGNRAIGVILTGMGRDGAEGLRAIRRAGGQVAVENEQTAVVYGMPKVALELEPSAETLPLTLLPNWVLRMTTTSAAPQVRRSTGGDLRSKPIAAFRVLVVDDQKSMRGLASHALKLLGFTQVDEAESGEAALQAVQQSGCDLVLADWNMAGMSGLDLVKALRKEHDPTQLVVLMTTSENHVSKVSAAMAAGANNYLVKPCEPTKLRRSLERALMRQLPV
jgi:two-component system chemotaxis response regulator CheB